MGLLREAFFVGLSQSPPCREARGVVEGGIMKTLASVVLATAFALGPHALAEGTIAVYDLEGMISEGGQEEASLLSLDMNAGRPLTHFDLVRSLEAATADESVKGVVLDLDQGGLGLAQVQELRRLLAGVRKAGKDVWLYADSLNLKTALVGSTANHFVLMPEGNVSLTGLYGENLYFKGLFDKIGVAVDVVHIGDFKSAGEMFSRTGPSKASARQMNELYDSLWSQLLTMVSEGRGVEKEALQGFVDAGFRTPAQAREAGLVDDLQYRTDFITKVREHYGEKTRFDREYSLPDTGAPEMDSMFDLFALMFKAGKSKSRSKDYVAVIVLDAAITDASIAPVRTEVIKATRDENCKGLLLRVNSPGGSALASEVLWEATDEYKATDRPFVVSMGGVAASGGYYVSAAADRIFAEQGTVTGSIGVVGMKLAMGGTMERLGITTHEIKRGAHADMMNTTRPFSDDEKTLVRKSMLDVYDTFKKRVADGRGDRLKGDLEALAGGRVYSGAQALKIGLIDELGGLSDALAHLVEEAGLQDPEVYLLPEPKDPFSGLFADPSPDRGDEFITMQQSNPPASALHRHLTGNPAFSLLDPAKREACFRAIETLATAQRESTLLIGPAPGFTFSLR